MENSRPAIVEEVKKEFQLERMILFSDAVFAIVITLMAIEIRIPDTEGYKLTSGQFNHYLLHLLPVFLAYAFSFFFIGRTWYAHLQLFGFIKKYNGGLVFCNLLLLFSIGLFPFAASVLVHIVKSYLNFIIYFGILGLCIASQLYLRYYVLIKHPELRNNRPVAAEILTYKSQRNVLFVLGTGLMLIAITNWLITDPASKELAIVWVIPVAIIVRLIRAKLNKAKREMLKTSLV
ncbi:TMEM175 family protein [Mucilaginibacter arboris]|uniref:DUF1211 domain-containing protein n=1 Tax=Mucilaginibacter arboris TaxID=2682090 RepID=A0A7K1SST2_9SPHI|nr:TMEM175 family protein [Mucilaginibacter arboris]MVN20376.1 DUF1211 domain-containing protein [Mucilaginibacter arboris]